MRQTLIKASGGLPEIPGNISIYCQSTRHMSFQQWLVANLGAPSIWRRSVAFGIKLWIEGLNALVLAALFVSYTFTIPRWFSLEPYLPLAEAGTVLIAAWAFLLKQGWCYTARRQ